MARQARKHNCSPWFSKALHKQTLQTTALGQFSLQHVFLQRRDSRPIQGLYVLLRLLPICCTAIIGNLAWISLQAPQHWGWCEQIHSIWSTWIKGKVNSHECTCSPNCTCFYLTLHKIGLEIKMSCYMASVINNSE